MKLDQPENSNYAAVVVEIKALVPLANCDNVVGTPLLGFQAIVSKDTKIGDIGIVFPAETQLEDKFCYENNLYRHDDKNKNLGVKGYIKDSRRVKAMKFRGHRSDCLFMSLESLKFTKAKIDQLEINDTFDTINGEKICKKYVIKTYTPRIDKNKKPRFTRVDQKFLPEHYDSDNFFRNADTIPLHQEVIITQKLHGTSVRIANTIVRRRLNPIEWVLKKLRVKIQETEFDNVYGSRKVIKDINNPNQKHYYEMDIWSEEGKKLDGLLPENFILYGELVGWTSGGAPIQKGYTYGIPQGTCELYVYRVAFVNGQGVVTDLSWEHVKEFCNDRAIKFVPELAKKIYVDFKADDYLNKRFYDEGWSNALDIPEDKKLVDEGICIRVDRMAPYILKAKSSIFLEHESKMLDEQAVDLEAQESAVAP